MGSWVTITMLVRTSALLSPLLALLASQPPTWSSLGLLSSQASKRSAEDSNESFMAEDTQTSASDDLSEIESYDMADFKSPEARVEPYRRRKKFRLRRRKNRYEPPLVVPTQDQELSPNVLYERDSSYNAPSSSYEAPGYSNSYKPPSYESPSYSPSYEAYGGGKDNFNDFLNALAAFLPIGLFLAAIPPNLIVINSRRKRGAEFEEDTNSVETVYPFLEELEELGGIQRLTELECQKKLFCELAARGLGDTGNYVQNAFGAAVRYTPIFLTRKVGLDFVFKAAKEGDCAEFKCTSY